MRISVLSGLILVGLQVASAVSCAGLGCSLLGEFHWILNEMTKTSTDSVTTDYLRTKKFIEYRTPEELYDLSIDPGCQINLADNSNLSLTLKKFRNRMKKVLQKTQDHELDNFLSFMNNQ